MDREEFRAGILDAIKALKDPNDEIHFMSKEGHVLADELRAHDPVLATKISNIAVSIDELVAYLKTKAEV